MKILFFIFSLTSFIFVTSCSHSSLDNKLMITTATSGLMEDPRIPFPVYLTNSLESKSLLEKKYSSGLFLIHTGHFLKPDRSKSENEQTMVSLSALGFDLVNITLEDFEIAELQGIHFSSYDLHFLNSSVVDLSTDELVREKNISPFIIQEGIAFVGLSDRMAAENIPREKYIVSDYVLSVLKGKKAALKMASPLTLRSFVIVHTIGSDIDDVMGRLPPHFINSKAN
jgi:hypothetical protein